MSSEKRIYLGGYIELPENSLKHQWPDLASDLEIHVDEFVRFSSNSPILISNYGDVNFANEDEEIHILTLNLSISKLMTLKFEEQHGASIKKINKYYKNKFEIKVGFISYWW